MISSDGHRILVCRLEDNDENLDLIIPARDIQIALMLADKYQLKIEVTPTQIGRVLYKPIDAEYVNWKKVIPAPFKGNELNTLSFNPSYMADYYKICKLINQKLAPGISVMQKDGNSPILVRMFGANDFFSLLKPLTRSACDAKLPDWIK